MKIIDLLNKIANGEETPDKFIYEKTVFTKENNGGYTDEDGDNLTAWIFTDYSNLNDEIEIIKDKKIEKLNFMTAETQKEKNRLIKDKINEIIDKMEEIK